MTSTALNRALANFEQNGGLLKTTAELPMLVSAQPESHRGATSVWKTMLWTVVAVAVLAAVAVQSWKWWQSPVAASEQHQPEARMVSIALPTPAAPGHVVLPATIRPWQTATLNARVSGYLRGWRVDLGARVEAGDLLAEIETPELDQELAQGIAQAREAEAAVAQAQAERHEAEAAVQAGEAELGRARAEAELARTQLVRREKLLSMRVVPQEEFDTYQKQVATRNAEVTAAESELTRRRANLATRAAVIEARQATVNSSLANVDRLKELQSFQRIVAPFSGVITRREAEVGMLVTAGKEPLFTIEDMSRVRVQVNVPQAYAVQTRVGAVATVNLPEAAHSQTAVVTRVADSVDPTTRTMLAEIELENGEGHWQPGSYAQVGLATAAAEATWTIPTNTLQMRVEGPHVAVVDDANHVEVRPITLGRDLGNRIMVASGITGHERLIVNPGDDLASGAVVRTRKPDDTLARR
jgi:multidrug efflux pump subunit AcrA (membrane-fusion protein)